MDARCMRMPARITHRTSGPDAHRPAVAGGRRTGSPDAARLGRPGRRPLPLAPRVPGAGRKPWLAAARGFRRGARASVAIETAVGVSVLVGALGIWMGIVDTLHTGDRMARAAHAAARSIALLPSAPTSATALGTAACDAIVRELDLAATTDCAAKWWVFIGTYESPAQLVTGPSGRRVGGAHGGEHGDMVEVRIFPKEAREPADAEVPPADAEPLGVGVARNERVVQS